MNERGWGLSPSEVRRIQLVEWIAHQQPDHLFSAVEFYDSFPDQSANTRDTAHSDLKDLKQRGLIKLAESMGGIASLHIGAAQGVRDLAEEFRNLRADKRRRKAACRDAMVAWLYSRDATNPGEMPVRDTMLDDPRHGLWWGEPFTARDLDDAAAWLHRNNLADGPTIDQEQGPVRLYLTDGGVTCAEDFAADTAAHAAAQRQGPKSGPTLHIGTNSAPFMMAGDNAQQTQNIGPSVTDLQTLISSLAEMVRAQAPETADIDTEEKAALEAVSSGTVDTPALRRFGSWVLSIVQAGTSAALVPMVSAAIKQMMADAAHIAAHL